MGEGATPSVGSEPQSQAGILPICKSAPRHFPFACSSPNITAPVPDKERAGKFGQFTTLFHGTSVQGQRPLWVVEMEGQEMGGMEQEREPRAEPMSAGASFPTPTPAPGSLPETGNACYQGLLRGVEKEGPSVFSPCSPLISRLQNFILQTREGGCAVHPFRSLQTEVQSINASSWPSKPTLLPPSLSSPLPSHPSTRSTSHCQSRGSDVQSLTPSPATAS